MRVPCVMRWPGKIPAGRVCDEVLSTMDLLPTCAGLASAALPPRPIDGQDVRPLLLGAAGAKSPWDDSGLCYYYMEQMQAVRAGPWKLYLPLDKKIVSFARKTVEVPARLFDVRHDVAEDREVSAEHPEVVERLRALADRTRKMLGDLDHPGPGQRPAGFVRNPKPLLLVPLSQKQSDDANIATRP